MPQVRDTDKGQGAKGENMNTDEIEINGKKYVLKDSIKQVPKMAAKLKNLTYCIVRTYSAGVFAGYYDLKIKGQEGSVFNARRLWSWAGAASLSQLSIDGTANPSSCKFPAEVNEVQLKQIIEVLPCTEKARKSIQEVKIWQVN